MSRDGTGHGARIPRRLGRLLSVLVFSLLTAELAGLLYFHHREGGLFYTAERPTPVRETADAAGFSPHRFDPYLGFTLKPGVSMARFLRDAQTRRRLLEGASSEQAPAWSAVRTNNLGFFSEDDYPLEDPDALLVGIFGGSVARMLALQGGPRLEQALAARLGQPVRVLNLARGGFKQPQQLLLLGYLRTLGQRLDVVVNLDGFNEVALGRLNAAAGVDTSMPSIQHLRGLMLLTALETSPDRAAYVGEIARLRALERKREAARAETRSAARWMLASLWLQRLQRERGTLSAAPPLDAGSRDRLLAIAAPLPGPDDTDEKIVNEWLRGSLAMADLAGSMGATYVHALQPNQYVGEHTFSESERRVALNATSPYREHVLALYPRLRSRAAELTRSGVGFYDAVPVFDEIASPVYADDCCHLNQRGNEILADHLAKIVVSIRGRKDY